MDITHRKQLPQAKVLKVQRIKIAIFHKFASHVKAILNSVRLVLFTAVGEHLLSTLFRLIKVIADGTVYSFKTFFERPSPLVYHSGNRIKSRPIRRDLIDQRSIRSKMIYKRIDFSSKKIKHIAFIT